MAPSCLAGPIFRSPLEGSEYLAHVREGLATLQKFPSAGATAAMTGKRKLRLAVTPTFARSILIPRLRQFTEAYPEIDLTLAGFHSRCWMWWPKMPT